MTKLYAALFLLVATTANAYTAEDYLYKMTQKGAVTCLSHAVFEEANTEPLVGKKMVLASILNRAIKNNKHVCNVIKRPYQYSFYHSKFSFDRRTEGDAEKVVVNALLDAFRGKINTFNGVDHYHTVDVKPNWNYNKLQKLGKVGRHIYYKEK
jgi:spore germination cell wall hydrolase CwlJ-like protein